jgi:glycosyltransferase involved in cell wall biosynthesis
MRILWTSPHCRPDWIERLGEESQGGQTEVMFRQTQSITNNHPGISIDIYTRYQDNDFQINNQDPDFIGTQIFHNKQEKIHIKQISERVRIIRLASGPSNKYIKKEFLYGSFLDEFVDNIYNFIADNKLNYHLAHGHYADGWETVTKLSKKFENGEIKLPTVLTTHSLGKRKKADCLAREEGSEKELNKIYNFEKRILSEETSLHHAQKICPLSTTEKEFLEKNYQSVKENDPRLEITPNGINPADFQPPKKDDVFNLKKKLKLENKFTILIPSRVDPRKGQLTMVKALNHLGQNFLEKNKVILLLIAWPEEKSNYTEKINNYIQKKQLDRWIIKHPPVPHQKMPVYMDSAELIVIPSQEYFSIAMIESMLLKKPLIASHNGGSRDAIIDNQTGFLVDHNNSEKIAQKIKHVINLDQNKREAIGIRAKQRILENYTLKAITNKIFNIYKSIYNIK